MSTYRKIVYLINPIAGVKTKSLLQDTISRETGQQGIDFEIVYTNAAGDYRFLAERVRNEKLTDVVVCGGDGSINAVAAALLGEDVNIGIIPMGSGNGLALTAKIPLKLRRALDVVFRGKVSYVDGCFINDRFSCMLCGIGFDAKVAHEFAKQKRRGLKTYIKVTGANFFSAKPYVFEIHTQEKSFTTEAYFISVANSNQFGNNFTIAPRADLSDGLIDVVIVKKMSKLVFPFSVIGHVTGFTNAYDRDDEEKGNIVYFQTSSLTIINPQNAPLHIDGDPADTAEKFDIRVVPQAIRLIQP
ncbi:MAG: YegS/Rv2252/BmrU family lipid kinase [Williamsia sp.]|nr:YegS/Rv2252/BmrU family lipid kinase [Williamsia sp.]